MEHDRYCKWLCSIVGGVDQYERLLCQLYSYEFIPFFGKDNNQAINACGLRATYTEETGRALENNQRGCSILELMIYCSERIEDIMRSSNYDDRTSVWFWEMVDSLGLLSFTDDNYDESEVDLVLSTFNQRMYAHDGRGGLFTLKDCTYDLREVDIWFQLIWKVNELLQTIGY